MDSFSVLSDELLIKILSFAPTKVAVSTSVLSKRWEYLWMWLPKLQYGHGCNSSSEFKRLQCFLDRNMPLHRAPVIESLHLDLTSSPDFKQDSIKLWIVEAISRFLRELEVNCDYHTVEPEILPTNLYTCKSLVILKLQGDILLDVPRMVYLPSLKTLHLKSTSYFGQESLPQLLPNCPILEDLQVDLRDHGVMGDLTVVSQSLQSLSLNIPYCYYIGEIVIKTPALKYFKLVDSTRTNHYCLVENMPNLIEAYIDVRFPNIKNLIRSLTSVKHLAICSGAMYDEDFVFNQLRHLQICKGKDLLARLLKGSPNLQVLDLFRMKAHFHNKLFDWNQPSTIPECMLSSLQTFNCDVYKGAPGERDLAVYILKNASHLRTTTIKYYESEVPKFEMLKELALTSRTSTTCQLVFDPIFLD